MTFVDQAVPMFHHGFGRAARSTTWAMALVTLTATCGARGEQVESTVASSATPPTTTTASETVPTTTTVDTSAVASTTAVRQPTCPAATAGNSELSLTSGGITRTAIVHVPPGYTGSAPTALVVDFHGHGGNSKAAQRKHGFDALADRDTVIVAYPQGATQLDDLPGWSTGSPARDGGTVDDVAFTNDLLDALGRAYCVDATRTFVTGHSNGGGMTGLLACALTGRFAAAAPVSGAFYPIEGGCRPTQPVPIIEIHGTADRVVPYTGTDRLISIPEWLAGWSTRNGCSDSTTTTARTVWTGCDAALEHIAVAGASHEYPTGSAEAVWEFFTRQGL